MLFAHGMPFFTLDTPVESFFGQVFSIGHLGVDMFFVISGFLITGILIEDWEGAIRLRRFYLRRYLKIYPQYLFALLFGFSVLLAWNVVNVGQVLSEKNEFIRIFVYFFLAQNYTQQYELFMHTWSLAVEEHFYLMYPLVVRFLFSFNKDAVQRRFYLILFALAAIILTITSRHLGHGVDFVSRLLDAPEPSKTTFFRIDALIFGCLLKFLEPYYQVKKSDKKNYLTILCFLAGVLIYGYFIVFGFLNHWDPFLLAYLASGCMFIATYRGFWLLKVVSENSFIRWIGRNSYAIYLWHYILLQLVKPYFSQIGVLTGVMIYMILSLIVGVLTTVTIEKFFLTMRRKIIP